MVMKNHYSQLWHSGPH